MKKHPERAQKTKPATLNIVEASKTFGPLLKKEELKSTTQCLQRLMISVLLEDSEKDIVAAQQLDQPSVPKLRGGQIQQEDTAKLLKP